MESGQFAMNLSNRRSITVWASFISAMTMVGGFLVVTDPSPAPRLDPLPAADITGTLATTVMDTKVPVEYDGKWLDIVLHHSGTPYGSKEMLAREHKARGLDGLGYHFLIGNGNGMGNGELHVGYRWNEQLPGAHVLGQQADWYNQHSIGICLIGNGNQHPFTEVQINRLVSLIRGLQYELNIPRDRVRLHSDLADVTSPGRFLPADFSEQLASVSDSLGG